VRSLAKIKVAESSRALISALSQKTDSETKVLIAQTLGEMRDLSAVPSLLNLLRQRAWLEENYELLAAAALALGQIGSREAVPVLIRTLHRRKWFQREPHEQVRIAAAQALGLIGGENEVKALRRYLGGKDDALEIACEQALAQAEAGAKGSAPGEAR
jgi:HEAT repeat protein